MLISFFFSFSQNKKKPAAAVTAKTSGEASAILEAKKKATLKAKKTVTSKSEAKEGGLGGADYVNLMMGGRSKAREEAAKLPMDLD